MVTLARSLRLLAGICIVHTSRHYRPGPSLIRQVSVCTRVLTRAQGRGVGRDYVGLRRALQQQQGLVGSADTKGTGRSRIALFAR